MQDVPSYLDDVLAAIIRLGQLDVAPKRLLVAHPHTVRQVLHLGAGIVVVVLTLHLPPYSGQQAGDAVPQRGVAAGADMHWPRWVGADELHLDSTLIADGQGPERSRLGQDGVDLLTEPIVGQGEVQKPWQGGLDAGQITRWIVCDLRRDGPGDLHR